MKAKVLSMYVAIFMMFMMIGCSHTGNPAGTNLDLSAYPIAESMDINSGLGILGEYSLMLDPSTLKAELTPFRNSTIGESFMIDGMKYFTRFPCTDCFNLNSVTGDSQKVTLNFKVKHPLLAGNPALPPSGTNRLDLFVFDLAAVVKPQNIGPIYFIGLDKQAFINECLDQDGFTSELTNVVMLGQETLFPFFLPVDNDARTGMSTFNAFNMGTEKLIDVSFRSSGVPYFVNIYLTFGYGASATFQQRLAPKYFNPEFNRKAAWKVVATPQGNWSDSSSAPVNVRVDVYDWQHGFPVYANPDDYANAPTIQIYSASDVESVDIEVPGFSNVIYRVTTPSSGTGMPGDPLVFMVPVSNENHAPGGDYTGLVKVKDSRIPETTGDPKRDCIITTTDGKFLQKALIPEYATYQTFTATVVIG